MIGLLNCVVGGVCVPQVDYFVFGNSTVKNLISFLWAALFRFSGFRMTIYMLILLNIYLESLLQPFKSD